MTAASAEAAAASAKASASAAAAVSWRYIDTCGMFSDELISYLIEPDKISGSIDGCLLQLSELIFITYHTVAESAYDQSKQYADPKEYIPVFKRSERLIYYISE